MVSEGTTMAENDLESTLGPALAAALAQKGYTTLTRVQEAVLDPALAGRDLRISSQTGSGKTVAIGFTLRDVIESSPDVDEDRPGGRGGARPRALVVTPTRELAKQVCTELSWLYAPLEAGVAAVTGGSNYRDERRALGAEPAVVVGTPGRLLDYLDRGGIDASGVGAVVFDEADRMLDLGFREDLEKILAFAPPAHRTHLVSATFPREVLALADRVQRDPVRIEATPLGTANTDIEHLIHLVQPNDRLAAIVNLLLATKQSGDGGATGAQTLVFARTRADVAELTQLLGNAGFTVDALSGEMEQRERNRALDAFKRGHLDALVATDVAARGIDVVDVVRVIHAEPPTDADAYTHRSGRTGRAGRKGTSSVLVTPPALNRTSYLLKRAGVRWAFAPVPTAEDIRAARDERLYEDLTQAAPAAEPWEDDTAAQSAAAGEPDERAWALAKRIAATGEATRAIARLVARLRTGGPEPREVRPLTPPSAKRDRVEHVLPTRPAREARPALPPGERRREHESRGGRAAPAERDDAHRDLWVPFRVSWGQVHGADTRRLLAMVCRRGGIQGTDVGSIKVARTYSVVQVSGAVARAFENATREPDPRDPRVRIRPWSEEGGGSEEARPARAPRIEARPREVPAERPSRARAEVPAERPSRARAEVPAERPSRARAEVPAERPSRARAEVPAERPSRARAEVPAERPSRARAEVPAERPSRARAEVPAERPSRARPPRPSASGDGPPRRPSPGRPSGPPGRKHGPPSRSDRFGHGPPKRKHRG